MEKQVIQSVGFRNIKDEDGNVTGFQFKVRLPYYRGIFLSQIRPGTLYVDGEKIEKDEIDMDLKTAYVEDYLLTHKSFSFMDLMEKQRSKMEIIVTFMVILELMKTGKITIVQEDIFDDIWITSKAG